MQRSDFCKPPGSEGAGPSVGSTGGMIHGDLTWSSSKLRGPGGYPLGQGCAEYLHQHLQVERRGVAVTRRLSEQGLKPSAHLSRCHLRKISVLGRFCCLNIFENQCPRAWTGYQCPGIFPQEALNVEGLITPSSSLPISAQPAIPVRLSSNSLSSLSTSPHPQRSPSSGHH